MQNYQDMKNMFIDAVFITAESGDWDKINFEKLCKVLKVKPSEGYKLFPGVEAILDFYSEQITDLVRENLDKKELREVLPREALLEVLMCRLDLLNPRKSALKIITEHSMRDPCSLVFTLKRVKKSMNIMISESEINIKRGSGFILEKSISFLWILTLRRWLTNKESDAPAIATLDKGLKKIEEMGFNFTRHTF